MTQKQIDGIAHEVNFWRGFVQSQRFKENWLNPEGNPELEQEVKDLITPYLPGASVLDVGSGPVSILRGFVPAGQLITADPLAEFYKGLVDFNGLEIKPPIAVTGEQVVFKFEPNQFDICHIRNALDHSQRPSLVIDSMLDLLKPGGLFIAHGFENEANFEKWQGLHQWNIAVFQKGISITGADEETKEYRGISWKKKLDSGKEWFFFTKKKSA